VDDEELVREAHAAALERGGWTVVSEGDPARAKKRVRQENFDVIVTDLVMPGLSGVDLLRAVREHDLDVPVVILTGRPDLQSAVDAVQFGAFRYVAKPVTPAALLDVVRSARNLHLMAAFKREALELLGLPHRALGDRASLESRFERALDSLWLSYQPVVTIAGRRVVGYDTVVGSDEETLRSQSGLFDAAERVGRLQELGRKIRKVAARDARELPDGALLFLSAHPDTLNDFDFISPEAPLSSFANRVVLGITERASLDRVEGLQSRLSILRELGYRVALDNLGTGYAGLASFTLLQPDYVKLDASLVRAIDASYQKRTIVKAMLQLADRDLNLIVICEGVETVAERWTLMSLGADLLQGDLFAPLSRGFVEPKW
jgi:EAL domain-containing protein (putative c-di-GMP-specific phosphodiesterase class I)